MDSIGYGRFTSVEEEAKFWDTHSPLDFPNEFRRFNKSGKATPAKRVVSIRLDEETIQKRRNVAKLRPE